MHLPASICVKSFPLVLFLSLQPLSLCQMYRASLNGTVSDAAGKVMPETRVTAFKPDTGLRRETTSSVDGTYVLPQLPVGLYTITFEHAGFAPLIFRDVDETVGHNRTLDATLQVGSASTVVEVSGGSSLLNQTSDTLGARIAREQVNQLPLNGRNWSTLTVLVPGAVDTGGSNQRTVRFAGRGLDDNNFTYDGIDATNIVNQAQQSFVRLAIPTDSIQEFRVDTMLFTAENGSTPGGQVDVVSRAGTNQFHGNIFEFLRNSVFDAREPAPYTTAPKPPFRLNQFGGAIGGPVRRDRTFFYFTYEGLRQTLGQPLSGFVPSDPFRAQVAAESPELIPILNAYPHSATIVSGTNGQEAQFVGSGNQTDQEDSAMWRLDESFSPQDSLSFRFNFDAASSTVPLGSEGAYLNDRQHVTSRPVNSFIDYLHLFSPTLINEAKFGFNRGNVYTTNLGILGEPYSIAVSGFTTLNSNLFKIGVGNSYSYIDDVTWVKARHTFKSGVEVRRVQLNQGNTSSGTVTFSSQSSFAGNSVSSATYAAELPVNGLRKTEVYAFVQDEWKVKSNLTFNLGVRYIFFNRFHEVLGRALPFDFATCGAVGFCGAGAEFSKPRIDDIDPRVAVTWSPAALGNRTIIRAGYGVYHGDGQLDDQNLPISNEVGRYSLSSKTIPDLSYPVTPFLDGPGTVSPRDMDRTRKDMYVSQWGLSVQQALPFSYVSTLSYVGSKGTNILTTSYVNLIDPATGLREYANFGQVEWRGNINNSSYEALVVSLQRPLRHGLLLSGNYTYSHQIDQDAPGGGDADFPQNPACLPCERASGDYDSRNVLNLNAVYQLPFGRGRALLNESGVLSAMLGNWDASTIWTARAGLPINVTVDRSSSSVATGYTTEQRPDRVIGVPLRPAGGSSIQNWINPAAFAVPTTPAYGTAGRNLLTGPTLWQADLGIARQFSVTERVGVQFRTEFFNIFNRAQYGQPLSDFSSSGNFGLVNTTANVGPVGTGTPRQVQFLLRINY
jgi:hypothetical protein